jgi:hypothetical protein
MKQLHTASQASIEAQTSAFAKMLSRSTEGKCSSQAWMLGACLLNIVAWVMLSRASTVKSRKRRGQSGRSQNPGTVAVARKLTAGCSVCSSKVMWAYTVPSMAWRRVSNTGWQLFCGSVGHEKQ